MKENRKKQFELLKKYFESIIKDNHYSRLGKVFTTSKKKYLQITLKRNASSATAELLFHF